ncbi:MAG TPA: aminotransferase class I/II-fold pyridoxal phosphate-dependent enzyme [Steroidobacteraceae bacterium]|nr:aminotransferase class I/II-fold pyridoxal phosphate-dependent enzyme [Steroidobacteraceae bacterium]
MPDFTSALYLGLRHPSAALKPWRALSSGRPAALAETAGAATVAAGLARLTGCEAGTLLPSTLHLFLDLFASLPRRAHYFVDASLYPVARWGVERAVARGATASSFAHYDAGDLARQLARSASAARPPVAVIDGFCPACGVPAPLRDILAELRRYEGMLVVDDTQALGIFGQSPGARCDALRVPEYGCGGGGMLRFADITGPDIVVASSLAKAFGVPVAMLAGTKSFVTRFARSSATRVHCSPPSVAVVHAAERALAVNAERGDALRLRLAHLVRRFRAGARGICALPRAGAFPVLTLGCEAARGAGAVRLHRALNEAGVRALLHAPRDPRISFLISAAHGESDVDDALAALQLCLSAGRRQRSGVVS